MESKSPFQKSYTNKYHSDNITVLSLMEMGRVYEMKMLLVVRKNVKENPMKIQHQS